KSAPVNARMQPRDARNGRVRVRRLSDRGVEQIQGTPQRVQAQRPDADPIAGQAGVQLLLYVSAQRLVDCAYGDGCCAREDRETSDQDQYVSATAHRVAAPPSSGCGSPGRGMPVSGPRDSST